jgi:hypothetical protein
MALLLLLGAMASAHAEVAVSPQLVAEILSLIAQLQAPARAPA